LLARVSEGYKQAVQNNFNQPLNDAFFLLFLRQITRNMKLSKREILFYFIIFVIATVVKIICAPQLAFSGFNAMFSVALFGGLMAKTGKNTFIFPIIILLLSDLVLQGLYEAGIFPFQGFYSGQVTVYALFVLLTLFGMALGKFNRTKLIVGVLAGPTLFFLISNLLVWVNNGGLGYTKDLNGLLQCYTAGLPFYKNSLIATMIFLPSFVLLYNMLVSSHKIATVKS
jgi:hypothetical protein